MTKSELSVIKPVNTKILFQFIDDISDGRFRDVSRGGIALVKRDDNQVKENRWGKVLSVGTGVDADVTVPGDYILIEALGWTTSMSLDDSADSARFWFTDVEKVMCVSDELPDSRL